MSGYFINTITPVLVLVLFAGRGDARAAQLASSVRAGPAPNGHFAAPDAEPPSTVVEPSIACVALDDDSDYPLGYDATLDLAIQAVQIGRAETEKDGRKCYFGMAQALARHLVFKDPNHADARYWYAAAMALRAAEEGGRTQVGLAQRAHEQANLTLTLVPDHAGAQHVLGRLHAAVMRLSGFKRWIATKILGGKALSGASWATAESFLAAAARLQPETPVHHYELGALYLDTDRPELALAAFEQTLATPPIYPADHNVHARAERTVGRLLRGEPVEDEPEGGTHSGGGRRKGGRR